MKANSWDTDKSSEVPFDFYAERSGKSFVIFNFRESDFI